MRRHLTTLLGFAVSVLLLWWVLRGVSFAEVAGEMRAADPVLFLLAVAVATSGFLFRAIRWRVHLLPVAGETALRPRFAATSMGFAANNLLPARVGEFVRAFALSRITPVRPGAAFGGLVIERLLDGMVVVALLFVTMATPGFPALGRWGGVDLHGAALLVAAVVTGATLVLWLAVLSPERSLRWLDRPLRAVLPVALAERTTAAVRSFVQGLAVLGSLRLALLSLAWAVAQWLVLGLSFLLAFRAFGIDHVGFAGALFLQSVISLAVAIPSSPGFFGPYEAAAVLGLGLWGVGSEAAVSFAIGFHLGGFIPVTVIGLYYAWRLDFRWRDLRRGERALAAEHGGGP